MVIEYVYGLLTKEKEYIYVGVTNNPERRIDQHDTSMKKGKISQFYEMIILDKYEDREQSFIDRLEKEGHILENKEKMTDVPSREYHIGESLSRERIREKMIYQRDQKHQERLERRKKKGILQKNYFSKYKYNVSSKEGKLLDSGLERREVMYKYGFTTLSEGPRRNNKGIWYNIDCYTIEDK